MDLPLPTPSHPLLDRLWRRYAADVPHVQRFCALAAQHTGSSGFENDHIALRTVANDGDGSGIRVFADVFERLGWRRRDPYVFPDVHLRAVYLSQPGLPRVFISELDPTALPVDAQRALSTLQAPPAPDDVDALAAWFSAPARPDRGAVDAIGRVSQYAAWLLCFDRRVNHFTAAVDDVAAWQQRLIADGVPMKAEIEGDVVPDGGSGLRQTATAAAALPVTFADGSVDQRPYAYFEIAERKGGFDGFLAQQARQLFDQTRR
ncbi:MAG TPA: DUF1338 family protein [Myxococcota bacterium]